MKVKSINIKGLHGFITKKVIFNDDITLMVGINGTGKTSILKLINAIFSLNFSILCTIDFDKVEVDFEYNNFKYRIKCEINDYQLIYHVLNLTNKEEKYSSLNIKLTHKINGGLENVRSNLNLQKEYSRLSPDDNELETYNFIAFLPSPCFIGLDRSIYIDDKESGYIKERSSRNRKSSEIKRSPLDKIKELISLSHRKSKSEVLKLTEQLQKDFSLFAFDNSIFTFDEATSKIEVIKEKDIDKLEKRVYDYFEKLDGLKLTTAEKKKITEYFSKIKDINQRVSKDIDNKDANLLAYLNGNQFKKIQKLTKKFEKYEENLSKVTLVLDIFIDVLNNFFSDSGKFIIFNEETSELLFSTHDEKGKIQTTNNDLMNLSSGEQQILILLSYIAFGGDKGNLFIIDEPELSLHIKWQEDFLTSVEKLINHGNQILIATHSPVLVGMKKESVILL